jgi:hypothetical protein
VKRHSIIVQGKGSELCRERIYAFPTKEEEKPHGKEKGTDKEKDTGKEESTDKETKGDKVYWPGH